MKQEKAYKLLSLQEGISNKKAKELIDQGVVYSHGKKILIARALMDVSSTFKLQKVDKISTIFEDSQKIVLNKPAHIISENISKNYNLPLLHRLDKETSGVLILTKDEEFRQKAIEEFKTHAVKKIYYAIVHGKFAEAVEINEPILTTKTPRGAKSKISQKGKEAISLVEPVMIEGGNSLVKVSIKTGRTHQIRTHLQHIGYPILGDSKYGGKEDKRIMLHSFYIELLGQSFTAQLPSIFKKYGFNI